MPYRPRPSRRRLTTSQRGYGAAWQRLSRSAIAAQPWCSYCGATADLTADHPIPLARGGDPMQVPVVACRSCNGRRGADSPTQGGDPGIENRRGQPS